MHSDLWRMMTWWLVHSHIQRQWGSCVKTCLMYQIMLVLISLGIPWMKLQLFAIITLGMPSAYCYTIKPSPKVVAYVIEVYGFINVVVLRDFAYFSPLLWFDPALQIFLPELNCLQMGEKFCGYLPARNYICSRLWFSCLTLRWRSSHKFFCIYAGRNGLWTAAARFSPSHWIRLLYLAAHIFPLGHLSVPVMVSKTA